MIVKHHLWSHTYLINHNQPFQEYWECRFCGLYINAIDPLFPGPITICDKEIPAFVQNRINEANEKGCPFYVVQRIMEV